MLVCDMVCDVVHDTLLPHPPPWQVLDPADDISTMNETYWVMRAELVTEEETALSEGDRVVHVYHFITDKDNNTAAGSVTTFGDPFLLRIGAEEQMDSIKARIR